MDGQNARPPHRAAPAAQSAGISAVLQPLSLAQLHSKQNPNKESIINKLTRYPVRN
jgi:hypothetical protein